MSNESIVFGLEFGCYDAIAEDGKDVVLNTPILEAFASASHAVANKEGINIVEGDLSFFASDGSPLAASFSEKSFVDTDKLVYFPGIYSLQRGLGATLQDEIAKCISQNGSPLTKIMIRMPGSDSHAQICGWADIGAMKLDVECALQIFPTEMRTRIEFETP